MELEQKGFGNFLTQKFQINKLEPYIKIFFKPKRAIIAKFRLKNFTWDSLKDTQAIILCPICREVETLNHILFEYPALEE